MQVIGEKLTAIQHRDHKYSGEKDAYALQMLRDIHLYQADGSNAGMQIVRLFLIVAVVILLIASINYVNLSTARSILRSKEVGVRKVVGANRWNLFFQFIVETMIVFLFVTVMALLLVWLLMPVYNNLTNKEMVFNLIDGKMWMVIGLTTAGTLVASSIYPAIVRSSFEPLQVLKGNISLGISSTDFRKTLVVIQFIFSIGLISGTIIISKQLEYIHEKELGYDKSHVFYFGMREMRQHYDAVVAELEQEPDILNVTSASGIILDFMGRTTGDINWQGKEPGSNFIVRQMVIDEKFIPVFDMELVAGRNFRNGQSDSASFILNETAVREMGLTDPLGKSFTLWETRGTIVGVVKDFHFGSLKNKIEPAVFHYSPANWNLFVKVTGEDPSGAIAAVEKLWNRYNSGFPFNYKFMDDSYDEMYRSEQRTGKLFKGFAFIAILISCLGLFGLATYAAQVKIKEIGLRKVMGASVGSIVTLLSKDFIRLILIALIIATPLAWYAMHRWLRDFVYRIEIQ